MRFRFIQRARSGVLGGATAGLACLALAGTAGAHEANLQDRDDTRGPLDIESVRLTHKDGKLAYTIETYDRFTNRDLRHKIGSMRIFFFVGGGRMPDYELHVSADDRGQQIFANLGKAGAGPGVRPKPVRYSRPNPISIRFVFSERLIGSPASFRWRAETEYRGRRDEAPRNPAPHTL
jgi:hypothetical protein